MDYVSSGRRRLAELVSSARTGDRKRNAEAEHLGGVERKHEEPSVSEMRKKGRGTFGPRVDSGRKTEVVHVAQGSK